MITEHPYKNTLISFASFVSTTKAAAAAACFVFKWYNRWIIFGILSTVEIQAIVLAYASVVELRERI